MSDDPFKFDEEDTIQVPQRSMKRLSTYSSKAKKEEQSKSSSNKLKGGLSLKKKDSTTSPPEAGEASMTEPEVKSRSTKTENNATTESKDNAGDQKKQQNATKKASSKPLPKQPTSWKEVKAFIAVKDETKAQELASAIEGLGGKVQTRFTGPTTHLIFEGGKKAHFDKATEIAIPAVTPQWVKECEKEKKLLAPAKFAAELSGGKAKQKTPKSKPAANGEGTKDSS